MTTYSFKDSTGVYSNPSAGTFQLVGGNDGGIGTITVTMETDRSVLDIAADGGIMGSVIPGNNGRITLEIQQTCILHGLLLGAYNILQVAADNGDVGDWFAGRISLRNLVDFSGHNASGVAFLKVPPKTYSKQGQMVTWELIAANIVNQ